MAGAVAATIDAIDQAFAAAPADPAPLPVMVFDRLNGATVDAIDQTVAELTVLRAVLATIPWDAPFVEQQTAAVNVALAKVTLARHAYLAASRAMAAEPEGMH